MVDHTDGIGYGYAFRNLSFVSLTVTSVYRERKRSHAPSVRRGVNQSSVSIYKKRDRVNPTAFGRRVTDAAPSCFERDSNE